MTEIPEHASDLLRASLRRVKKAQIAYTRSATRYGQFHYALGGAIIVLSTLAAVLLFAPDPSLKVASAVMSAVAAVLATLQTFYRFGERADKFRTAGAKYGELRLKLEHNIHFSTGASEVAKYAQSALEDWNRIRNESPAAPQSIWDRVVVAKDLRSGTHGNT